MDLNRVQGTVVDITYHPWCSLEFRNTNYNKLISVNNGKLDKCSNTTDSKKISKICILLLCLTDGKSRAEVCKFLDFMDSPSYT